MAHCVSFGGSKQAFPRERSSLPGTGGAPARLPHPAAQGTARMISRCPRVAAGGGGGQRADFGVSDAAPSITTRLGRSRRWAGGAASPFHDIRAVFSSLPLPFLANLSVISLTLSPPFSTPLLILAASSCRFVWPLPCPGPLPCPLRGRGGVTVLPSAPGQSLAPFSSPFCLPSSPSTASPRIPVPPFPCTLPGTGSPCSLFLWNGLAGGYPSPFPKKPRFCIPDTSSCSCWLR